MDDFENLVNFRIKYFCIFCPKIAEIWGSGTKNLKKSKITNSTFRPFWVVVLKKAIPPKMLAFLNMNRPPPPSV